jgi:hypothetical protein
MEGLKLVTFLIYSAAILYFAGVLVIVCFKCAFAFTVLIFKINTLKI